MPETIRPLIRHLRQVHLLTNRSDTKAIVIWPTAYPAMKTLKPPEENIFRISFWGLCYWHTFLGSSCNRKVRDNGGELLVFHSGKAPLLHHEFDSYPQKPQDQKYDTTRLVEGQDLWNPSGWVGRGVSFQAHKSKMEQRKCGWDRLLLTKKRLISKDPKTPPLENSLCCTWKSSPSYLGDTRRCCASFGRSSSGIVHGGIPQML